MKQIVEVPFASGGSILVETEITDPTKLLASTPGEIIKTTQTMESALLAIKPLVASIVGNLMESAIKPDEVTMKLGLGLSFGSGGILKMLVATGANASCNVSITWKRPEQRGPVASSPVTG